MPTRTQSSPNIKFVSGLTGLVKKRQNENEQEPVEERKNEDENED